jgi:hypothetical protein
MRRELGMSREELNNTDYRQIMYYIKLLKDEKRKLEESLSATK